jgi:hypothetical protein
MTTKQDLINRIDRLSKDYDALIDKHGYGARSSYVSADLDTLSYRIAKAREQLALLDIESPCDDWTGGYGKGPL